jgi:hypothetical protein
MKHAILAITLIMFLSGCAGVGGQVIILFADEGSTISDSDITVDDGGTDVPGILYRSPVDVGELDIGDIDKSRKAK